MTSMVLTSGNTEEIFYDQTTTVIGRPARKDMTFFH